MMLINWHWRERKYKKPKWKRKEMGIFGRNQKIGWKEKKGEIQKGYGREENKHGKGRRKI